MMWNNWTRRGFWKSWNPLLWPTLEKISNYPGLFCLKHPLRDRVHNWDSFELFVFELHNLCCQDVFFFFLSLLYISCCILNFLPPSLFSPDMATQWTTLPRMIPHASIPQCDLQSASPMWHSHGKRIPGTALQKYCHLEMHSLYD